MAKTVPPGTLLVYRVDSTSEVHRGDLRNNSDDSRFHDDNGHLGGIPLSRVDGVVAGTGTLFSYRPLASTTAFTDAGFPGTAPEDRAIERIPWLVLGGGGLALAGVIGLIVTVVRSARRGRRAVDGITTRA